MLYKEGFNSRIEAIRRRPQEMSPTRYASEKSAFISAVAMSVVFCSLSLSGCDTGTRKIIFEFDAGLGSRANFRTEKEDPVA